MGRILGRIFYSIFIGKNKTEYIQELVKTEFDDIQGTEEFQTGVDGVGQLAGCIKLGQTGSESSFGKVSCK